MSTLDELSGEIKQKAQGTMQFLQQAEHLFELFSKSAKKTDEAADNIISQALDKGELTSFSFTGQVTDITNLFVIQFIAPTTL